MGRYVGWDIYMPVAVRTCSVPSPPSHSFSPLPSSHYPFLSFALPFSLAAYSPHHLFPSPPHPLLTPTQRGSVTGEGPQQHDKAEKERESSEQHDYHVVFVNARAYKLACTCTLLISVPSSFENSTHNSCILHLLSKVQYSLVHIHTVRLKLMSTTGTQLHVCPL